MKKTTTFLGLMAITTIGFAQSPRISLFEEFTGENCPPCASTNPYIDPILAPHQGVDCITLKWQVAIPSAPTSLTSLYQQNKTEINARDTYYSIGSAPAGKLDGQEMGVFGAVDPDYPDHASNINDDLIASSSAVSSPFTLDMIRTFDPSYTSITVTGTITASQNYTATGPLKFILVMTEKEIHYTTAPGSNGEKDFHWVARKSFPDLANGTAMVSSWTTAQTQTFSIVCPIPSYIWDKSQIEMVGFIQDDGNKMVLQAGLGQAAPVGVDALAQSFAGLNPINCVPTATPQAIVKNNGVDAITTMTINAYVDAAAQTPFVFSGNIAAGATASITLNPLSGLTGGNHTFSVNIVGVNAGDNNIGNNTKKQSFVVVSTYAAAPIVQTYSLATFPGTGWLLINSDAGASNTTWARTTAVGAYGVTPAGSAKYSFYNNANIGDIDELYMPAMSLTGVTSPALKFDLAYATYLDGSTELNDGLDVKISTDCGASWNTIYSNSGAAMATAPTRTVAFVPTASQWTTVNIPLTTYANAAEVLVKFVTINDFGNNLYIDNVNVSQLATGIKQVTNVIEAVELFPNPTSNETALTVSLINESNVTVNIINNVGQVVYTSSAELSAGSSVLQLDTKNYASGIYNVIITSASGSVTKKLSVTK
ncbi:MAG: T9SS type A sorting domain-containing protein [Bacteroidota bacterium]